MPRRATKAGCTSVWSADPRNEPAQTQLPEAAAAAVLEDSELLEPPESEDPPEPEELPESEDPAESEDPLETEEDDDEAELDELRESVR